MRTVVRECLKYDISLNFWNLAPSLNEGCSSLSSFTYKNEYIYIIGGMNSKFNGFVSNVERLDLKNIGEGWERVNFKTNAWTGRYGINTCQISSKYFIIFGGINFLYQNQCFLYDIELNSIMYTSRMQQAGKFENQLPQPVLYKNNVYSIDDEKNLHIFNINTNYWSMIRWSQWKPSSLMNSKFIKK